MVTESDRKLLERVRDEERQFRARMTLRRILGGKACEGGGIKSRIVGRSIRGGKAWANFREDGARYYIRPVGR